MNLSHTTLAYIGIGLMGLPMSRHLMSKGYHLRVYDIDAKRCEEARAAGAQVCTSPAQAVEGADFVLCNLPTSAAVQSAVFGEPGVPGVASAMKPPQLLIDFSTIPVDEGKEYARRLQSTTGCNWVDAPVSGGPPASAKGELTVMAGGAPDDIARIGPLMQDISARFTHMGPTGSGLATKMLNQLIVGCLHSVMAEAANLAESAGIEAAKLPLALGGGHADGTLLQRLYPRMVARDFQPQGYVRQLRKDLEMVTHYASELQAPTPMLATSLALYRELVAQGHSELDTAAVFKLYKEGLIPPK